MQRGIVVAMAISLAWTQPACDSPVQCSSAADCGACASCRNGTCVDNQEICNDGIDNDCDLAIDEGCTDACESVTCNNPPAPICSDATTVRLYAAAGTCTAGSCSYDYTEQTCTSGCDPARGACADCIDRCLAEATQCASGQLRTCQPDSRGCLVWADPVDCPDPFCQDFETCGTCTHECPSVGASDCTDGTIKVCADDEHGCRVWSPPFDCPTDLCEDSSTCATCVDLCPSAGATRCTSGTVQQCVADGQGCLDWGPADACPTGHCADAETCLGCADDCPALGATECTDGQIRACETGTLGCLSWTSFQPCADGFCASASACGVDPCLEDTVCAGQNRECENQTGTPVCTACLPGFHDEGGDCTPDISLTLQFHETSYDLSDTYFVSDLVGWAVGDPHWDSASKVFRATVIKTSDGGQTWAAQDTPVVEPLRGVFFVDADTGWSIGAAGTVLKTSNGGQTWIDKSIATDHDLRGVAFVDASHGWVTGIRPTHDDVQGYPDDWRGRVWHTNDGGDSWTQQTLPNEASILNRVAFVDTQTGWIAGIQFVGFDGPWPQHEAAVYRTVDGGQTWVASQPPETSIVLTGIDFVDASTGWVVGFKMNSGVTGGTVFATADGGQTWQAQDPDYVLWDVEFVDANRGYAVGTMYGAAWGPPVIRTQDGGATWETAAMEQHDGEGLYGVAVSASRVVAVGDDDFCARSVDPWGTYEWPHGENLFSQAYLNSHYRFEEVFFANVNDGWAVGKRSWAPSLWGQVAMKTHDGGDTWSVQYESPPDLTGLFNHTHRLDSVSFVDANTGWAVGGSHAQHGAILFTDNGGATWTEQGSELYASWDLEFYAVEAISAQEAWALANMRFPEMTIYLARTVNGGASWEWVGTGVDGPLGAGYAFVQGGMAFADAQHGWAVGGAAKVLRTHDGGATWNAQALPNEYGHVHAVTTVSELSGWVAGEYLFRTVDGGSTWTEMQADVGEVYDIEFVDPNHGWLAGAGGALAYTVDGGDTWQVVARHVGVANAYELATRFNPLFGLSMVRSDYGFAVGGAGTIFRVQVNLP